MITGLPDGIDEELAAPVAAGHLAAGQLDFDIVNAQPVQGGQTVLYGLDG
jgi:hypothetical protein